MTWPKHKIKTGGRVKGVQNKHTRILKDAILLAAEKAGGKAGIAGYLNVQSKLNPGPFMALLGKVLPLQVIGDKNNPLTVVLGTMTPQQAAEAYAQSLKEDE